MDLPDGVRWAGELDEDDLVAWVASCKYDPVKFVREGFNWGHGDLKKFDGPDDWQADYLRELGEEIYAKETGGGPVRTATASGHGVGKAQPKSLVIDTPRGPTPFGHIKPGDEVFGADGSPTRVTHVHDRGVLPVYEITFDDGSSTYACGDHLWNVRGRQERRKGLSGWRTVSTQELLDVGVKRPNGIAMARQWEIPRQGAAEFPEQHVLVEPYTLGCWLGDGSVGKGQITSADPEMMARIGAVKCRSGKYAYTVPGLYLKLKRMDIVWKRCWEKFVPDDYKYNTPEVRRLVLAGLLDTDGEVGHQGSAIFTSTSRRLAEDVAWLARSLGYKARISGAKRRGYKRDGEHVLCRDAYSVHVTAHECPFLLPRKRDKWKAPSQERYLSRWIDRIELVGELDCQCITVEAEDSLYLTNDFIATHNSAITSWFVLWYLATRVDALVTVTANTERQLKNRTWRELSWPNGGGAV